MFKKILLAFDGSEHARKALNVAIDLALRYNAKLLVVEVIDLHTVNLAEATNISSYSISKAIEEIKSKASGDLRECIRIAKESGVDVDGEILEGDPAAEILRYSEEKNVDLIITGSRGLSRWKRLLMGSVSNRIVSEAKVATLVVK